MSQELRNNEELQEEFKTLLGKIDPYFNKLRSLEKLLCREWLHKLLKTGKQEESLRNAYLIKLYNQLEKGKLIEPFNNLPRHNSSLLPLTINNLSKQHNKVCDNKTKQMKEDTLTNVHETIDVQKSMENQEHTNAIEVNERSNDGKRLDVKDISDDSKEVKLQNPTLDKSEGGDGLTLYVETKLKLEPVKKVSDELKHIKVCDKKTDQIKEDTLITHVTNVHETVDVQKSTENQEHTNLIGINERSNDGKRLDVKDNISDDSKEVKLQNSTLDKSEGGDGLTLYVKTKLKLESLEKVSDELKKKSELLTEQIHVIEQYADKNILNNDKIVEINATLYEYKNDMENQRNQETVFELDVSKSLKIILDKTTELNDKLVSEMNHLTAIVDDACATKKSMNFFTEKLKEQNRLNINKTEKLHIELTKKLQDEISQLKEYVVKVEERAVYHQSSNECYEDEYSSA